MSHWDNYNSWDKVQPPFSVNDVIVDQYAKILQFCLPSDKIAILGCTKSFIKLADTVIAYDNSLSQVREFPGLAIHSDWNEIELPDDSYDAVLGDGSLAFLEFPNQWINVINKFKKVSKTRVICRVFEAPTQPKSLEEIVTQYTTFDCLRLDLMFFLAHIDVNVPVKQVRELVYHVRNKNQMSEDDIAIIENYKDSDVIYRFPKQRQIMDYFPNALRVETAGYSMAQNCPIYIF